MPACSLFSWILADHETKTFTWVSMHILGHFRLMAIGIIREYSWIFRTHKFLDYESIEITWGYSRAREHTYLRIIDSVANNLT